MNPVTAAALAWRWRKWIAAALAVGLVANIALYMIVGASLGALTATATAKTSTAACGAVAARPVTTGGVALDITLDAAQQAVAAQIGQTAVAMHAPELALQIAYMTGLQESSLRNLPYGDRDSVGVFQQRPSQGWGTPAELQDVAYATTKFLTALLAVPGWQAMPPGVAAQAVQRSADPTGATYTRWQHDAQILVAQIPGTTLSAEGGCGVPSACPATSPDREQHLTPDALAVLRCGLQQFPQVTSTAGWAPGTGHITDSLHYQGRAVDFMLPYPAGSAQAVALGDAIAAWFYDQAGTYGVSEIIWNARIRTKARGWVWRPYRNPQCGAGACGATLQHLDHVHISVAGAAGTYGQMQVTGGVVLPIPKGRYTLTAGFGQCGGRWAHCHTGQDFAAPTGTPIHAVTSGVVVHTGFGIYGAAYGNLTDIQNGASGVHTWYAHQSAILVQPGQAVTAGQVIGLVGATGNTTGPHLHLEVRQGGQPGTPVDPIPWLKARGLQP